MRKIMSKIIAVIDKKNFTTLNPSPAFPMTGVLNAFALMAIYKKENIPPPKSKRTFSRLQPWVDFLAQFRYTCGIYLTNVMLALQ